MLLSAGHGAKLFLDGSVAHVSLPYRMMHAACRTHSNMLTSSSHEEVIDAKTWWHTSPPSAVRDDSLLHLLIYFKVHVDKEFHCVSCYALSVSLTNAIQHCFLFFKWALFPCPCPRRHFCCQSNLKLRLGLLEALQLVAVLSQLQVMVGLFAYMMWILKAKHE